MTAIVDIKKQYGLVVNDFDIGLHVTADGTVTVYCEGTVLQEFLLSEAQQHGGILLKMNFFSNDLKVFGVRKEDLTLPESSQ